MGYQDERHAAVRGHVHEECFEGVQATGGRADTDDQTPGHRRSMLSGN
jgi:hypothetical protein